MRIRTAFLAIVGFSAALLPATGAHADSQFTFYGEGFGHGLGMSQWGAFGLAERGWSHQQILTHYYSGTSIAGWTKKMPALRVGLTQGRHSIHLEARGGPLELTVGKDGPVIGQVPAGETWALSSSQDAYRILDAHGDPVGGKLWGGESDNVVVSFPAGSRASVPEASHTYARGRLEFNLYGCGACRLRLIAVVPMERYLYGLAEVSNSWPMEAMKAQADAARTYALRKILTYGQHRPTCNCGLYATAADQVYAGWDKESDLMGDRWMQAVDGSAGEIIEYAGSPIQAFYMASSGGFTESNENVWGGTPLPYLRGVCDPGDFVPENSSRAWMVSMSAASVTSRLHAYTGDIGTVTGFENASRGVSGRIISITVHGTTGSHAVSGGQLKAAMGLRDDRVWINQDRRVTGEIRARYDHSMCAPGAAKSAVKAVPGGSRQRFEHGAIYDSDSTPKTVWLHSRIYDYYRSIGGPAGSAGFPLTGVHGEGSGSTWAGFEHGTITCVAKGACALH